MISAATDDLLPHDCIVAGDTTRIGRWSMSVLAAAFGTPLYVYDAVTLRENARDVQDAFTSLGARVSFAAKACSTIGVLRTLQRCGLDVDVVSEGEMVAAIRAGFRPQRIHLHGNCKSDHELQFAVRTGIRAVVVDNADELVRLASIATSIVRKVQVMVRVSLPIETETHPSLRTSGQGSKFGVAIDSDEEERVMALLRQEPNLTFVGLHTHVGSQITDPRIYERAGHDMVRVMQRYTDAGLSSQELSLGGGWAVAYTSGDVTLTAATVVSALATSAQSLQGVRLAVEPGRALVAHAALALYRVGAVKVGPAGRIIAVDGGMGDNPRPALYNASYTAFLADLPLAVPVGKADVVGRYCESGDVLARAVPLPDVVAGDLICVPVSGAYQLSMASSYNLVSQPASVIIDGRDARLMTRRATITEMLSREVGYSDWKL